MIHKMGKLNNFNKSSKLATAISQDLHFCYGQLQEHTSYKAFQFNILAIFPKMIIRLLIPFLQTPSSLPSYLVQQDCATNTTSS